MDGDEELADVVGLGKSDPHMTWEKDGEQEGGTTNSSGRSIATKIEKRLRAASYGGYETTAARGKP